jgi:LCP family protein required for cell wall assembly
MTVVLGLIAAGVTGYVLYRKLDGNITTEDITQQLGPEKDRPKVVPAATDALNILLMGSDNRDGDNKQYGDIGEGTQRSDTTILLHIAADRKSSVAVSIPRDLMTNIPSCVREGQKDNLPYKGMFNEAFEIGGSACTVKTVEQMTKVRIDHHMVVDFTGFKNIVDAVGGVEVCVPEAVRDTAAKLDLQPGRQKLNGEKSLAYVRARKNLDDGSDTQRMTRQQKFLASLVKKVKGQNLLTDGPALFRVADAATRSLRTDPGLNSVKKLMGLVDTMREIPEDKTAFLTVPRQQYRFDTNRDELVQPEADRLFEAIRYDRVQVGAPVDESMGGKPGGEVTVHESAVPPPSPSSSASASASGAPSPSSSRSGKSQGPSASSSPSTSASASASASESSSASTEPSAPPLSNDPLVTVTGRTAEQDVCA